MRAYTEVETEEEEQDLTENGDWGPLHHLNPVVQQWVNILVVDVQHCIYHNVQKQENRQAERYNRKHQYACVLAGGLRLIRIILHYSVQLVKFAFCDDAVHLVLILLGLPVLPASPLGKAAL